MTPEEKLTRELKELKRLTGISFSIDENETADTADIAEKIKLLSDAFREKNSRTAFFKKLLSGELEVSRIYEGASRLHLPVESPARIYVIETENVNDESALMVLRQIGAGRSQDHLVPMDGKRIAVIKSGRNNESEEDALMLAHMFVDMLNAEAMVRARCAFGECIPSLTAMPEAYREAGLALEVGRIFYTHETVMRAGRLGIGQLIYRLPEIIKAIREGKPIYLVERLSAMNPLRVLRAPLMWLERLFVVEPHSQMVEVALCAFNAAKENNIE